MKKIITLISTLLICNFCFALDSLTNYLQRNGNIKANFIQKVISGNKTSTSSGELIISRPNKFKWSYKTNSSQFLVSDGKKVYIYDQDLQQVIIKSLSQLVNKSPATILAGSDNLKLFYNIISLNSTDGNTWYKLTAKHPDENNGFSYIMLAFDKSQQIHQMKFLDTFGNQVEILFSNVSNNIGEQSFSFKIPEGVDVIDNSK
jgi:outer membrane lipoprotein carrier protein